MVRLPADGGFMITARASPERGFYTTVSSFDGVERTVGYDWPPAHPLYVSVGFGAEADPNQLESAILNLAVNARDAMPDGGKLTIEAANAHLDEAYAASTNREVKAGQYVMVSVSDTGSGMPPEVKAKAFEPFFITKPVGKGTGLGLAQVYGFAKQPGEHAAVYSEPGQGTTVTLFSPRLARAQDRVQGSGMRYHCTRFDRSRSSSTMRWAGEDRGVAEGIIAFRRATSRSGVQTAVAPRDRRSR